MGSLVTSRAGGWRAVAVAVGGGVGLFQHLPLVDICSAFVCSVLVPIEGGRTAEKKRTSHAKARKDLEYYYHTHQPAAAGFTDILSTYSRQ